MAYEKHTNNAPKVIKTIFTSDKASNVTTYTFNNDGTVIEQVPVLGNLRDDQYPFRDTLLGYLKGVYSIDPKIPIKEENLPSLEKIVTLPETGKDIVLVLGNGRMVRGNKITDIF